MRTADLIQHSAPVIGDEEVEAVSRVLYSGRLAQGPEVEAFEEECAARVGRRHAVAVSSGTAALHLALNALGVDEGSTVAAPSYACASLLTAIALQRATPYLCDVGADFNLDATSLPQKINATIVPHLFGAPAHVPPGSNVIEDIAQSFGGVTGSRAPLAITSFYATKMITTGEGGMVLTDDEALAEHVRDRRDYDNRDDFRDRFNYKLTDIQAALGRVQLNRLPGFIARRREIAARYLESFLDLPLELPNPQGHVFFRFVVATKQRDELERHLQERGIEAKRPVHRPAHHYLQAGDAGEIADSLGSYPGSERAHRCALSLPVHPNMLDEDVEGVIDSLRAFY